MGAENIVDVGIPLAPKVIPEVKPEFILVTKGSCPWCDKAKQLLRSRGIPFRSHAVTATGDLHPFIKDLGFTTVPQIWRVQGSRPIHIGGYEDLVAYLKNWKVIDALN